LRVPALTFPGPYGVLHHSSLLAVPLTASESDAGPVERLPSVLRQTIRWLPWGLNARRLRLRPIHTTRENLSDLKDFLSGRMRQPSGLLVLSAIRGETLLPSVKAVEGFERRDRGQIQFGQLIEKRIDFREEHELPGGLLILRLDLAGA